MKLKVSFCNKTVLRTDITRYAPLWGGYSLMLAVLVLMFLGVGGEDMDWVYTSLVVMFSKRAGQMALINGFYALFVAQALWGDLLAPRMCNSLHAMPVTRDGYFGAHLVAALLFALIPNVLVYGIAALLVPSAVAQAALLTLAPLGPYCESCCRYIDGIHVDVLTALALYRMRREGWQEKLTRAMTTAAEFDFIRSLSVYGAAILPLLGELPWTAGDRWYKRLLAEVRLQNANDPLFLQPRLGKNDVLTTTEKQILRLICADKSNAEIGEILDIRVSTVKSHVSSVLSKLGVNRRSEARTAAKKLWLISEDQ